MTASFFQWLWSEIRWVLTGSRSQEASSHASQHASDPDLSAREYELYFWSAAPGPWY
jgi:hypothetical protein